VVQVCGAMTSSGSESIVSAMFASLSYTKESRGIAQPEIVIADSAHAAYYKAAKYAGARCVNCSGVESA
jgi:sphinganine-1-phosphate aldolase